MRYLNDNDSPGRRPGHGGTAGWACARALLAGLLVVAGMAQCQLGAQTNTAKAARPPDRYLLIVETSKVMQRRADSVLGIVQDMVMSGLNGQVRAGSTLGVWTFNESLSAGRLPLQKWSRSERTNVAERTLTFLKGVKYEKQGSFDKVVPALGRLISDSRRLTLIIISSGEYKLQGTPFDDRINASFQQWREQQQKARLPFVTILCATNGNMAAYAVNTPPWPLQVPQLAQEPKKPEAMPVQAVEARPTPASPAVAPLIVIGKKPQAEPGVTNMSADLKPSEPVILPVQIAALQPAPAVAEKPATELPPKPLPAPLPAIEPKPETVKAPEPKAVEPAPAKIEAAPLPAVAVAKSEPMAAVQPQPAATPEVKAQPEGTPAPIPDAAPVATADATLVQPTNSSPVSSLALPSARPAPPAQSATAAPAESLMRTRNVLIAAVLLGLVVAGFAILRMRRSRAGPQGSLITRSIERER